MSINPSGIKSAISDSCKNYDPIKSEAERVWSLKQGWICKCRNWENNRILVLSSSLEDMCSFCDNWQTPEGVYKNRFPEEVALEFYEKSPDKFIEYFSKQTDLSKKIILKKVFECDLINEKVIRWLDKEESELVREVGLSLI